MSKKILNKALVLLSGGQDSTTCLAVALEKFPDQVEAVAFDYGQRHRIELDSAKKIAGIAGVHLEIINIDTISKITENALTRHNCTIKEKDGELPSTFVEGRNLIFLSYAAIYAKTRKIKNIYTGVCQTDYSGYPDCRNDFVRSLNNTLNLAMDYQFKLITPLMWLKKSETVQLMQDMDKLEWYLYTHTCYEGLRPACGKCPACVLRLRGFYDAGIQDPLAYTAVDN
ncbi:MAG: 7-cyano-7-deazaguanine synthase QueC [bacterium]|nr:7-cyano-7-deazaguanine synthase QueC [bacterium]